MSRCAPVPGRSALLASRVEPWDVWNCDASPLIHAGVRRFVLPRRICRGGLWPPAGGQRPPLQILRGKTKRLTPACIRGEASQFHTSHGSTLLARSAERPGTGAQRDIWPLVSHCNGRVPSRSSRAAQEWYSRRAHRALSPSAPLSGCRFRGFFSVKAISTPLLYHQKRRLSRVRSGITRS